MRCENATINSFIDVDSLQQFCHFKIFIKKPNNQEIHMVGDVIPTMAWKLHIS